MTPELFAQIDKVDPTFLHQFGLLLVGLLAGAASAVSIYAGLSRRQREISPQPLVVKEDDKFSPLHLCQTKHDEIGRRLAGHDTQIDALWNTMRAEDTETRRQLNRIVQALDMRMGRIEGLMEQTNSIMGKLLDKELK